MVVTVGMLRAVNYRKSRQSFTSSGSSPCGWGGQGRRFRWGQHPECSGLVEVPEVVHCADSREDFREQEESRRAHFPGATDLVRRVV